jgi:hypothetical protein
MLNGRDMSTIFLTLTRTTHPIYDDRYLLRAMTPEACRCRGCGEVWRCVEHLSGIKVSFRYLQNFCPTF